MEVRLEATELAQRREVDIGDVSDEEVQCQREEEKEEEIFETRIVRAILGVGSKPKLEVPMYEGSLDAKELINWISAMNKYFEYENVANEKKIKFLVT